MTWVLVVYFLSVSTNGRASSVAQFNMENGSACVRAAQSLVERAYVADAICIQQVTGEVRP